MIKPNNQSQGRCLFFCVQSKMGPNGDATEELIALLGYKKETQEAPANIIETARHRLRRVRGR